MVTIHHLELLRTQFCNIAYVNVPWALKYVLSNLAVRGLISTTEPNATTWECCDCCRLKTNWLVAYMPSWARGFVFTFKKAK